MTTPISDKQCSYLTSLINRARHQVGDPVYLDPRMPQSDLETSAITNLRGMDINAAASHDWTRGLLIRDADFRAIQASLQAGAITAEEASAQAAAVWASIVDRVTSILSSDPATMTRDEASAAIDLLK